MTTLRLIYAALGVASGLLFPYTSVMLMSHGLSVATIGLVFAVSAAVSVVAGPIWGHLADVVLGQRRALRLAILGSALAQVAFGLLAPPAAVAIAWVTFSAAFCAVGPLSDALTLNALPTNRKGDFGGVRLFMSMAFAVTAITTGFVFNVTGYGLAPLLTAATYVIVAVLVGLLPDVPRAALGDLGRRRGGSPRAALMHQRRLPLVLATMAIAGIGIGPALSFMSVRIEQLGGSPSDIALASGLDAVLEAPGFLLAAWAASRIGVRGLYVVAGALMAACLVALGLAGSPVAIIAVRTVMGLAFAGLILAPVITMSVLLPASLQGTGQMLGATTGGIVGIVSNVAGGLIYGVYGASVLFLAGSACVAVAAFIAWFVLPGPVQVRRVVGSE